MWVHWNINNISVVPENSELFNGKTEITITEQLEGIPKIGTRPFFEEKEIYPVARKSNAAKKSRELFPENISNYPTITSKLNDPISSRNNAGKYVITHNIKSNFSIYTNIHSN